jgi:general secretion pathway protein F
MPPFAYQAVDPRGKRTHGRVEAASAAALSRSLEDRGLLVLEVAADETSAASRSAFKFGRKREVLEVTRAMAALLPAGMPLAPALGAAANVATGDVREALITIRSRVERGESLAMSLSDHPHLFPPLYVGLVRAGEKSGDLGGSFERLSDQLEREEQLRAKLIGALVYPLILATAGTFAVLVLVLFVLPRFMELLQGSGATLPRSTALLLALSVGVRQHWYLLFSIPLGIAGLIYWFRATPDGQRAAARLLLSIPAVRTLRRYALAARFSRIVGVLLSGGAPLLTALDDALESLGDPIAREDTQRIRQKVRDGMSLRQAVAENPHFPQLLPQLVAVGEEAGRLKDFLLKAATIFEDKTERAAQRLATLAEPAMIIFFGAIVAFVALSLLQAIYSINATSFK